MKHKLYAFWKHDVPPYVLGGEVTEIKSNGRVCVKGFTGCSFLPLQILPLEEGRAKQKEIDLALKNKKSRRRTSLSHKTAFIEIHAD